MTHKGIDTFAATSDWSPIVDTMAASGPTAFATSFAPCANESKHTNTSGRLNSVYICFLLSSIKLATRLAINGRDNNQQITKAINAYKITSQPQFSLFFSDL